MHLDFTTIYLYLVLTVLGFVIGSFLGVVVDRLPKRESLVYTPSHCNHCRKRLKWYDLIPVISYLLLQGHCRYCHETIGTQVFLIETITGVLFFLTAIRIIPYQFNAITLIYSLYMVCSLTAIFFIDYNNSIIPDVIVYPGIVISLINVFFTQPGSLLLSLSTAVAVFMFFFFLFAITKGRGMGFGDVKFSFLLALFLGFPNIIFALYVAFLTGAVVAFILIIAKKKKFHGGIIPFGPFLSLGGLTSFYYGVILEKIFFKIFS